jgi:RNase P subunit RPR2
LGKLFLTIDKIYQVHIIKSGDDMHCPVCDQPLKFRKWSERQPAKSEALATCPVCGQKYQVRYFEKRPTSAPYQVKPLHKAARGSYRLTREREAAIRALWGSVQEFLDHAPLVGMTRQ